MAKKPQDFESILKELESIVGHLESGELPLEEAINEFESAVRLVSLGQEKLAGAQQRIEILMQKNSQSAPVEYKRSTADEVENDEEDIPF